MLPAWVLHQIFVNNEIQLPDWPKIIPQAKFHSVNEALPIISFIGFLVDIPSCYCLWNFISRRFPPPQIPLSMPFKRQFYRSFSSNDIPKTFLYFIFPGVT